MSFSQQRLWFFDQLAPGTPVYNIFEALNLVGPLNLDALEKSFSDIVRRHEALRTTFGYANGEPAQFVHDDAKFELFKIELRINSGVALEESITRIINQEASRPFDLSRDLMFRGTLIKITPTQHVLLITMHHIASDGWSLGVFYRELAELYNAMCESRQARLPELTIQYPDFAVWQHRQVNSGLLAAQLRSWKNRLAGAPEILELPTDRPRPAVQTFRGSMARTVISPAISTKLKEISRLQGASLFMTLLAAFNVLLQRFSRQDDLVVAAPLAGRKHLQTENLIGFFINTLALRTDLSGNPTFAELLLRVRESTLDAYANQDAPFDKLVTEIRPERSSSHAPLCQVAFAYQNGLVQPMKLAGLEISRREVTNDTAKFDLTLFATDAPDGLLLDLEYNCDLFDAETITRTLAYFGTLLETIAANPEAKISELSLLTPEQQHQLVQQWNSKRTELPPKTTVHSLFERTAAMRPNAIAVQAGRQKLTYRDLNDRANQLANALIEAGVEPGTPVAVYLDRSIDMIVSFLAILKAGAAYLPIDISYPKERIAFMLEDSQAPVVITHERFKPGLPSTLSIIALDTQAADLQRRSTANAPTKATTESLAYVIYTSGSTGQPKGACIPHRAINRLVINPDYVRLDSSTVIGQISNCAFDAATFEIWGALLNGGKLVILESDILLSPELLARNLKEHRIGTIFLTTALFNLIARELPGCFKPLQQLLFGGEAADARCVEAVLKAGPPAKLVNVYGPTETTTFATAFPIAKIPDDGVILIGKPITNTQTYVLDEHLHPVPPGMPGELYVGGPGVGLGYLNRPELTAKSFLSNPFDSDPASRLYKTGDLVRHRPDGNIEFLGRIDLQVKIRGFRIEPGEIEAVLARNPAVHQCAVVAREDLPGEKTLVAYIVPANAAQPEPGETLGLYLKRHLPDYMVPAAFVTLPELPLNSNGKINRRALPAPSHSTNRDPSAHVAPRDPCEQQLVVIWEEILPHRPIGIRDNFFQLGGHSLLAVRLALRIEKSIGKRIMISTIFQNPTIEQLSAALRSGELTARPGSAVVEIQSKGSNPPLFLVHGVGGGMFWGYRNLSRYLGEDQPVYVLKSRAMDGHEEEFSRIEDMAAQYVADLRAFQPHGPYFLGGYCFGGNVAYEMACQLTAQGEHVEVLAVMNCAPPNSDYGNIKWTPRFAWKFLKNLSLLTLNTLQWTPQQRRDFIWWKARLMKERLSKLLHNRADEPERVPVECLVDLSLFTGAQRRLWQSHIEALLCYHPQPYAGKVMLFRARVHPLFCSFDPLCGWAALAQGGVTLKIVDGPHEGILDEPHVRLLASELKACLKLSSMKSTLNTPGLPGLPHLPRKNSGHAFSKLNGEAPNASDAVSSPCPSETSGDQEVTISKTQLSSWSGFRRWRSRYGFHLLVMLVTGLTIICGRSSRAGPSRRDQVTHPSGDSGSDAGVLSDAERHTLLVEWNATDRVFCPQSIYSTAFEGQVQRTPHQPAVRFNGIQLTYLELNRQANQYAHLLREKGISSETIVGLFLERSIPFTVSLLATLKAGGAFLPLDTGCPSARTDRILQDARPAVVLTTQELKSRLPQGSWKVVVIDDAEWSAARTAAPVDHPPASSTTSDNLAYLMYTSGSTGFPKGVEIPHRALLNHNYAIAEVFQLTQADRVLQMAALTFDLSIEELFPTWLAGACVVLRTPESLNSISAFHDLVAAEGVTILDLPTIFWHQLVDDLGPNPLPSSVRLVAIGGDKVDQKRVAAWKQCVSCSVKLVNTYGPTETTVSTTYAELNPESDAALCLGRPLANMRIYVLDENMEPVPPGTPGELYIGGIGLARGYRNQPELTARKFIPNPFLPGKGERLYRTGDRVFWREDGALEFLGRMDQQVKIRGYRVELGEIEAALKLHDAVKDCCVVAWPGTPGEPHISAYVVAPSAENEVLERYLQEHLPAYMLPASVIPLENIPRNTQGKLQREELPKPTVRDAQRGNPYIAPRTPMEIELARIWSEILNVPQIGIHDDFLQLGGHSLHAMRIASRVSAAFDVDIPPASPFEAPSIAAFAAVLGVARPAGRRRNRMNRGPGSGSPSPSPLSFAQQRLWLLDQISSSDPAYNIPQGVRIRGRLNVTALKQALREMVGRHTVLRTTYFSQNGTPVQVVNPLPDLQLETIDVDAVPPENRENLIPGETRCSMAVGLLIWLTISCVVLCWSRLGNEEHLLLAVFHHIAADAWSIRIFLEELPRAYDAIVNEEPLTLPELPISYLDYACYQREHLHGETLQREVAFWKNQLAGAPRVAGTASRSSASRNTGHKRCPSAH